MAFCTKRPDANVATGHRATRNDSGSLTQIMTGAVTHAAQLRVEGVDIGIISKQLGHRSIATTARYLDHIAPQQVIEAMQRRSWQSLPA